MLSRTVSIFPPLHRYLTFISRETHIRGRIDVRTRTKRRQHANAAWKEQMPTLVDGYLAWRHEAPTDEDNTIASNMFHVDVVGISDFARAITIQQRPNEPANAALLRMGLLGCSPLRPTIAIRIECLELYHQIRRRQSSFSIQAITKVLCALHDITYFRQFRDQFSDAFDIYLQILREIRSRVDRILGRDPNTWQINGSCPSCTFKVTLHSQICRYN
ncbi:hypothetical protein BDR03DRAFT_906698 [Suillus americanus]|nr:hypothetical protein BDR03DRAFT_906698 [Suillus americanus]